jgi:hypothetical protein
MKPTFKLRFGERVETVYDDPAGFSTGRTVRTLQQWWEKSSADQYTASIAGDPLGEWRDVPIEREQT